MQTNNQVSALRSDWHAICHRRGTPRPEASSVVRFLQDLSADDFGALAKALQNVAHGSESGLDMSTLSWASSCSKPSYLAALGHYGIAVSGATLFSVGLRLMAQGWDMASRIAQLKDHPDDQRLLMATIAACPAPAGPAHAEPETQFSGPGTADAPGQPSTEFDLFEQHGPVPTKFASADRRWSPESEPEGEPVPQPQPAKGGSIPLRLKLYGRDAAHTLEIGPHRRGGDFMGVHVVTVESARALAGGGGYDWEKKLTLQLTPEEMPAAIACLMGLKPAVKFDHHGKERDKFLEFRWQEDGIALVTGQRNTFYTVPVKNSTVFYVLSIFARALQEGGQRLSTAEVLALVGSLQG